MREICDRVGAVRAAPQHNGTGIARARHVVQHTPCVQRTAACPAGDDIVEPVDTQFPDCGTGSRGQVQHLNFDTRRKCYSEALVVLIRKT